MTYIFTAHTDYIDQYGWCFMRAFLMVILSAVLVLDTCLLGMVIAQWQKGTDIWALLLHSLNNLFLFL